MRPLYTILTLLFAAVPVWADPANVNVQVQSDRRLIGLDESISVKFTIRSERSVSVQGVSFRAEGFSQVNEFTGVFTESFYENGKFGARFNQQITKVLKPEKQGIFAISDISVKVDGKTYSLNPITVQVQGAGAGTPPPQTLGQGTAGGLRGTRPRSNAPGFFVKAEVDKQQLFKGEQLIVSYYLYHRVKVFNIQVNQFPTLNGFLREDLEMPVMQAQLHSERVLMNGVPYDKSLLVRYAAYPLKDGKLTIDPLSIKSNYYVPMSDDEDPFSNFFQQLQPKQSVAQSDLVSIDIKALPADGRPASFSGGVGDFNVVAAADKYDVKANEAASFTVKVEGKGNVAAIQEPQIKWPKDVEVYESKNSSKSGQGGVGYKVFEYLLIPRASGKFTLPSVEFSFFDPNSTKYLTRKTNPIDVNVLEGAPGSGIQIGQNTQNQLNITAPNSGSLSSSAPTKDDLRYLKPPGATSDQSATKPWIFWAYILGILGILSLFGTLAWTAFRNSLNDPAKRRKAEPGETRSKNWARLRDLASAAVSPSNRLPWKEVIEAYQLLNDTLFDGIDKMAPELGVKGFARQDLEALLAKDYEIPGALWQSISAVLEYAETVQYSSSAGGGSGTSEDKPRTELARWVKEAEGIDKALQGVKRRALPLDSDDQYLNTQNIKS